MKLIHDPNERINGLPVAHYWQKEPGHNLGSPACNPAREHNWSALFVQDFADNGGVLICAECKRLGWFPGVHAKEV